MAKPTMREGGERYVTLRVRQDLSLQQLAHVFWAASTSGYHGGVQRDGFPRNPAEAVRKAVASYLKWSGDSTSVYDDEEFTGSAEAQRWAFEHVARAYGFDDCEIPEPEVDERAARQLARDAACRIRDEDLPEDDPEYCDADHAEHYRD